MTANHFVHNSVGFREIENEVEFAHVAEVTVEGFDKAVDYFEGKKFVRVRVNSCYKV